MLSNWPNILGAVGLFPNLYLAFKDIDIIMYFYYLNNIIKITARYFNIQTIILKLR